MGTTALRHGEDLPRLRTDSAAAAQAGIANRSYARLLTSGTAVTTSQYVAALRERGLSEEGARARIKRDRDRKCRLITVTHDGEAILPSFQLDIAFEHRELAGNVVHALRGAGWGPWEIWDWAETPNPWIGRRTPAEAIRTADLDAVARALAAATGEGPEA